MESLKPFLVLVPSWAFYFFLHSAMASIQAKQLAYRAGFSPRNYRLFYSFISTILLLGLLYLNGSLDSDYLFTRTPLIRFVALFLAGGGIFILRASFKVYSLRSFVGINPPAEKTVFHQEGILKYIRHPIYTATILITLGFLLFDPRLATFVSMCCVWLYLPIGIYYEERKLLSEFGETYRQYRQDVPAIIPKIRKAFR